MKLLIVGVLVACLGPTNLHAQAKAATPNLATITDAKSWKVTHATAEVTNADGKPAVRLLAEGDSANGIVGIARPNDLTFTTGTIEIDLKGKNVRQRSFLGVAFNVVDDKTFEAIYFRPFNFKAEAPINGRSVQYISWPTNTWEHLRKTRPSQFENTVTPVPDPDGWFHAVIEVTDTRVRVFVNHAKEPSLVVTRLAGNSTPRPAGLFVDSSDGMYSNLSVTPNKVMSP